MGLTIHYTIKLNKTIDEQQAEYIVNELNKHALLLQVDGVMAEVSEIKFFTDIDEIEKWDRWLAIQSGNWERGLTGSSVKPITGLVFRTWPGQGCEPANFGICFYPSTNKNLEYHIGWNSFCKTQYASEVSVEHFVRCHLAVISMLDKAKSLGLDVEVNDGSDYWDHRSIERLVLEVGEWNEMIAGMVGQLIDSVSGTNTTIESPILEYQDFEELETKFVDR